MTVMDVKRFTLFSALFSFQVFQIQAASIARHTNEPSGQSNHDADLPRKLLDILQMLASRQHVNALDYILETNRGLGLNLFEGDITNFNPRHRSALRNRYALWSARRVPYVIDSSVDADVRQVIEEAIDEYHSWTCVRWVPRTLERDYVVFKSLTGCYSPIGRVGRAQALSLANPCAKKGTAMHEMLHVLGFFHEHSRPDRDQWVQILLQNVEKGKEGNFERLSVDVVDTLGIQYDYGSIMHYSRWAFSANGQPTILPKKTPNTTLGQRTAFSELDLKKINKLYFCGPFMDQIPPVTTEQPPISTTGPPPVTQPPPGWTPWGAWSDCDLQCRHTRYRFCLNVDSHFCPGDARETAKCDPPCQPAIPLGCFANEPSSSAIPSVEGLYPTIRDSYRERTAAIRKCADVATSQGYMVFALFDGGQCLTGPEAIKTYSTYGPSTECGQRGKGSESAMNVYSFSLDLDGAWGAWTPWGQCSRSCGGGKQYRYRSCDSPPPTGSGQPCQGHDAEVKDCNTGSCPTARKCGVRFHIGMAGQSGYIHVQDYENYMTCEYVIQSSRDDDTVSLAFTRMDIEPSRGCMYDALTIYEGKDDTGRYIGSYCGSGPLVSLQSTGPAFFIRFQSDSTTTGRGYTIQFTVNAGARKACVEPRQPIHGSFKGTNFVGDTIVFFCQPGYHLYGSSTSHCVDQTGMAVWTNSFPFCIDGRKRRSARTNFTMPCDFDGNLCGFHHEDDARWHWTLKKENNSDHGQINDRGSFLHVESNRDWLPYDTARITSPVYNDDVTPRCLSFRYRLRGNELTELLVLHATNDGPDGEVTWSEQGRAKANSEWKDGAVEFFDKTVQFTFEAVLGQYVGSSISLDDVMLKKGPC